MTAAERTNDAPEDFAVLGGGSVCLLEPQSEAAQAWLAEHCPEGEPHTHFEESLAVEHGFARQLVVKLQESDLVVAHDVKSIMAGSFASLLRKGQMIVTTGWLKCARNYL